MKILGIESSCDETAASVVEDGRILHSNVVVSQIDIHAVYGGVVPEVAARSHIEVINPVINQALTDAKMTWDDIDAIAVTYAPGLVGSLLVGTLAARTLAVLKDKPLYLIHHVEAHVYANFLTEVEGGIWNKEDSKSEVAPARVTASGVAPTFEIDKVDLKEGADSPAGPATSDLSEPANDGSGIKHLELPSKQPEFPMLALIVSGGHSQLVLFRDHGDYELLGQTQDDAIGEAFDKVAKILGLPYPGGPSIAKAALEGNPKAYQLPKAKMSGKYDFSFSGLKTAVLRAVQREVGVDFTFPSFELADRLGERERQDFAASFQRTAIETLVDVTERAYNDFQPKSVVIAGGVAANQELRRILQKRLPSRIEYAPMSLCTDNAAMIASLAYYYAQKNQPVDPLEVEVVPSLSMTKTAWSNL